MVEIWPFKILSSVNYIITGFKSRRFVQTLT
nr:hypothetical protein NICP_170 [Escherichia phage vB_Eco_NicPhage]